MKKTSAIIAVLLAVFSLVYFTNTALADKASLPSAISPDGGTYNVNENITFSFDLGGYSSGTLKIIVSGGSFDAPYMQETVTGSSKVLQIPDADDYVWRVENSEGPSGTRTFTVVQ